MLLMLDLKLLSPIITNIQRYNVFVKGKMSLKWCIIFYLFLPVLMCYYCRNQTGVRSPKEKYKMRHNRRSRASNPRSTSFDYDNIFISLYLEDTMTQKKSDLYSCKKKILRGDFDSLINNDTRSLKIYTLKTDKTLAL